MNNFRYVVAVLAAGIVSARASAQAQPDSAAPITPHNTRPSWVERKDFLRAGVGAVAVGVLSLADERIAQYSQRPSLQDHDFVRQSSKAVQALGDPGAFAISASLFVVGKLAHKEQPADASEHAVKAVVLSAAITQALKLSLGRARPEISNDSNAYIFHGFHGRVSNFNSLPSGHTSAAFAAATVFSREIARQRPRAARFATPALYALATAVASARVYNNRHWASDVAAGALIGYASGRRIVSHAHWSDDRVKKP